jgi:hypothetical protein
MTRNRRGMMTRLASTMLLALTACGSEEDGTDFTPMTGGAAGTSASGGTSAGTSGTAGSGDVG